MKFKKLLMENFAGRCAVIGWENGGVLDAAHIEHGTHYNPSNGILMTPTVHALFDSDLLGIHPDTLVVHFSKGIELGEQFEGRIITPLVYELYKARLVSRWNDFWDVMRRTDGRRPGDFNRDRTEAPTLSAPKSFFPLYRRNSAFASGNL